MLTGMLFTNKIKNSKQFHELMEDRQNVIKILISNGADCDILNQEGQNIWDVLSDYPGIKKTLFDFQKKFSKKRSKENEIQNKKSTANSSNDNEEVASPRRLSEKSLIAMFNGKEMQNKEQNKKKT